ncbi:ZetaCOP [Operophtera brumata]|uniref:Coatomer subunit zeta n=1 Tax=Operophtera brumata TaxID=104452 RepID=A0A0L7KTT0_OPEBR|nr:ZetaCOP [Operophtera brumata]
MVHTTMEGSLFEPTLYIVKGMCILDNEGNRILAKYYDKNVLTTTKEQKAFEKNLFNKTHRVNAEIIMLEGLTCVYKSNVDLFFYVMGSSHENESVSILVRRNVERRVMLDNLDSVMLAVDEICDGGTVAPCPTHSAVHVPRHSIAGRAALRSEDVPLGEQSVAQVVEQINNMFCTNKNNFERMFITYGVII